MSQRKSRAKVRQVVRHIEAEADARGTYEVAEARVERGGVRGRVAADRPAGEHDALDWEAEAALLRRAGRELHDRLDEAALGGRKRLALHGEATDPSETMESRWA